MAILDWTIEIPNEVSPLTTARLAAEALAAGATLMVGTSHAADSPQGIAARDRRKGSPAGIAGGRRRWRRGAYAVVASRGLMSAELPPLVARRGIVVHAGGFMPAVCACVVDRNVALDEGYGLILYSFSGLDF